MKTIFIHIGTPKTGTTAIQNFLNDNRTTLKKYGLIYPVFKVKYQRERSVRNGHWLINPEVSREKYDECMKHLIHVTNKFSRVVLTDEGFWNRGGAETDFWLNLRKVLEPRDIQLKVIVYLRRQDDYAYSYYAQRIKQQRRLSDRSKRCCG